MRRKQQQFWYDPLHISSSHAEITAGISGLALAILLLVFQSPNLHPGTYSASLFFVFSLVFGVLSALEYSITSGLRTYEWNNLLIFFSPSVAFGVSASTMFIGFAFIGRYIIPVEWFGHKLLGTIGAISLFGAALYVFRTAAEIYVFIDSVHRGLIWWRSRWFNPRRNTIAGIIVTVLCLALSLCIGYRWSVSGEISWAPWRIWYFYFLVVMSVINVVSYEFALYLGVSGAYDDVEYEFRVSKIIVKASSLSFLVFFVWSLIMLVL